MAGVAAHFLVTKTAAHYWGASAEMASQNAARAGKSIAAIEGAADGASPPQDLQRRWRKPRTSYL